MKTFSRDELEGMHDCEFIVTAQKFLAPDYEGPFVMMPLSAIANSALFLIEKLGPVVLTEFLHLLMPPSGTTLATIKAARDDRQVIIAAILAAQPARSGEGI